MLAHPECRKEDEEFDAWCDRVISALEEAKKKFDPVRGLYVITTLCDHSPRRSQPEAVIESEAEDAVF